MPLTKELQYRLIDGVQVMGVPKKVGKFYQYQVFAIQLRDGRTFEFYTDKIYRVRTVGKIGYATLKMIFINERTLKCFSRFVLFHFPENTRSGNHAWKHGQDELVRFSHNITIRCSRVLAWTVLERNDQIGGTRSFRYGDTEVYHHRNRSFVRLKLNYKTGLLGQYSVFAGNAKLSKELGFDITKAKFQTNVMFAQRKGIDSSYTSKFSDSDRTMNSKDLHGSRKMTKRSSLFRSCKSVCDSSRKRANNEGQVTISQQKREGVLVSSSVTAINCELECKMKILSYIDYLAFKKCQMGLSAGLVIDKDEAIAKEVISRDGNTYDIYFVRASFADNKILRSTLFEKAKKRKRQFRKKKKVKKEMHTLKKYENVHSDAEGNGFKEDNWKKISEDLFFDSVGYTRIARPAGVKRKKSTPKV